MITNLVLLFTICLFLCLCQTAEASVPPDVYMAKPNCPYRCGNIVIPYPFGIGKGCYMNEWYSINCCHTSSGDEKPFLNHTKLNLEVLNISLDHQTVTVNSPIASNDQRQGRSSSLQKCIDLDGSPFRFSRFDNIFMVLGCGHAHLKENGEILAGCTSVCQEDYTPQRCHGINCCQTTIPLAESFFLDYYNVSFQLVNITGEKPNSTHAFLVDRDWFSSNRTKLEDVVGVGIAPLSLLWMLNKSADVNPDCDDLIVYSVGLGAYNRFSCSCERWNYEGNPFLIGGCHVVKECAHCLGTCDSNYNGTTNKYDFYCNRKDSTRTLILGFSIGGGSLSLLFGSFGLRKVVKKKKEIRLKRKFFKRNGGLLLEQQSSYDKVAIEKIKIFTSKELEKATDNFQLNRILGQGGQGIVYKGMLTDGRIVAIKKSIKIDESQIEHFINETMILSQINHCNVVGLLGCCLETKVPLLVYEFISNGTLFQLIHNQDSGFPFTWKMRLQIASEIAGALFYLHSACSVPIYHRDIKSTNILLDDKYRAKVSDFGTSRSISIEQTHLTTLVKGTFGYLDPEYFQSSQFTEKSDVFSFGVVLVELLTGQKPICPTRSGDEKSLVIYFILSLEESRLYDIIDLSVVNEGGKEEIVAVADLAYRCLNMNGRKRPTMKEVAMELEHIRMSLPSLNIKQNFEEDADIVTEITGPLDSVASSIEPYGNCNKASSSNASAIF